MQTCHIVMCLQLHIVTYGCIPVSSSVDIFIRKTESSLKLFQKSTLRILFFQFLGWNCYVWALSWKISETLSFIRAVSCMIWMSYPVGILQWKWHNCVYLQRHIFSFTCQWIDQLPRKENYEVNQQKSSNHTKQLAIPDDNLKNYDKYNRAIHLN